MSKQERKRQNRLLIRAQNAAGGDKKKGAAMYRDSKKTARSSGTWGVK